MFWVACPSVEKFSSWIFFADIQSKSPRPQWVIICQVFFFFFFFNHLPQMENLAEHRLVGYLCTAAVKKISNFSACETE